MTEVTFFEDFHCFEYHSVQGFAPRFRYLLYSPVYDRIPLLACVTTHRPQAQEKPVYSSDFIPLSLAKMIDP
jgi:hypothetical protein